MQLVLAADVSRSMSRDELRLQREGYVKALRGKRVVRALGSGATGRAALTYVEWAGVDEQKVVVPWTVVASERDLLIFADRVENSAGLRPVTSVTSLSSALWFGASLFDDNGFVSFSRVIDISGDGPNDAGPSIDAVRIGLLQKGIVVNGLSIDLDQTDTHGPYAYLLANRRADVLRYYRRSVIVGPGSFALGVTAMDDFAEAMERKLVLEIAGTGESPAVHTLFALLAE